MKINLNDIQHKILLLKIALASKEVDEQMSHFLFKNDYMITFNDRFCVLAPFECGFTCSVKAEDFWKTVAVVKEEEAELSIEDTELKLESSTTNAGFATMELSNESQVMLAINDTWKQIEDAEWMDIPHDLMKALSLCHFSASDDATMGTMTCIAVVNDKVCGMSSSRGSMYTLDSDAGEFIFEASFVKELEKMEIESYAVTNSWVCFNTVHGDIVAVRKILGDFPHEKLVSMFKDMKTEKEFVFPDELREILSEISFMSDETSGMKSVSIKSDKKDLLCDVAKNVGWIKKRIPLGKKSDLDIIVNPIYLSEILEITTHAFLNDNVLYFNMDSFQHLLALKVCE